MTLWSELEITQAIEALLDDDGTLICADDLLSATDDLPRIDPPDTVLISADEFRRLQADAESAARMRSRIAAIAASLDSAAGQIQALARILRRLSRSHT